MIVPKEAVGPVELKLSKVVRLIFLSVAWILDTGGRLQEMTYHGQCLMIKENIKQNSLLHISNFIN